MLSIQEIFIIYLTIVRREINRFMRIWQQTLFPPVIITSLYFIIFGNLMGSRIGEMGGHTYVNFIAPGLILMSVITSSYANVSSSFFSAKFQRFIEELQVSPTPSSIILLGYISGGMVRGIIVGIIVTIVSLFFCRLSIHNLFIMTSIIALTSLLFSLSGFLNGILAKKFDDVAVFPTFILMPLTYLGGVFYSIKLLPTIWQIVSHVNPILYMINVFRYSFLGILDIDLFLSYSLIFFFIGVLFFINLKLLINGYGIRQ